MFEKDAEERTEEKYACNEKPIMPLEAIGYKKGFKDGAEFGYSKANEWHNLEENPTDLPKENMKQVIVQDLDGDYYMGWYCIHQNCWYDNECPDTIDCPIKVIKWKEIIFPKEIDK